MELFLGEVINRVVFFFFFFFPSSSLNRHSLYVYFEVRNDSD